MSIKKALEREAEAMEIEVDGTTIRSKGRVHSWIKRRQVKRRQVERRQVERTAWSIPGIIDMQKI